MRATIYHNPACGTSRNALALLQEHDVELEVIEYLETPPSAERLRDLMARYEGALFALVRAKDPDFAKTGLNPDSTAGEILAALLQYPKLLQRPIVDFGDAVVLARPADTLKAYLD